MSCLVKKQEETAYRIYISDALKGVVENTARFNGGVTLNKRYSDIVYNHAPVDNRSAEEIIHDITTKLRKVGECEPI